MTVRGVIFEKTITRTSAGAIQRGFFIQNLPGYADADLFTSDALFVFMSTFTTLIGGYEPKVGDEVVISGRVTEFNFHTQLGSARLERARPHGRRARRGAARDRGGHARRRPRRREPLLGAPREHARRGSGRRASRTGRASPSPRPRTARSTSPTWSSESRSARTYARRAFRDPHPLDNDPALFDDQNAYRILLGSLIKAASGDSFELIATAPTFSTLAQRVVGGVYFAFSKWSIQVDAQPVERRP